jgi:DNA topoisomerase-1
MTSAVYDTVTADVESAGHIFRANHSSLKFAGYTAVYDEARDEEKEEKQSPLPNLEEGDGLNLEEIKQEQKFSQPPPRYTEATLIKAMEETGIGRPSTYAPTVSTILDREYVVKEGKYLRPTPLGEVVTGLMKDRFQDIVDLKFTARMEEDLDTVEKGKRTWQSVLDDFYGGFAKSIADAETALEGEADQDSGRGVGRSLRTLRKKTMVVKSAGFGRFLACSGYLRAVLQSRLSLNCRENAPSAKPGF